MSLKGLRVVDLTRIVSGPFCTALLADLGADVIKVEPPGQGDPVRGQGAMVGGMSSYFANYNRNKRSITLDLYQPQGKQVLERLLAKADALVENFRPDVLERMGFTPARLAAINPDLVHCNINGFGRTGPYAERPAFDFIVQAMSGFMSCNGSAEGPPLRCGTPVADLVAGLYAALGVVTALYGRRDGRGGESLSVSMLSSLMSLLSFHATDFLNAGVAPPRTGNDHALVTPYGLFRTADGIVAIAPSNDAFFDKLVRALDLAALRDDPRFATNETRRRHRAEVTAIVEARTMTAPTAHWIAILNGAGVPCGPVYELNEVFADPQVRSQEIVVTGEHDGQPLSVLGFPIEFGKQPGRLRMMAPGLGQHGAEILAEIGYGPAEVAALRDAAVI